MAKTDYKQPAFTQAGVIIKGLVKFSNLKEPSSFTLKDGTTTEPKYSLTITFEEESETIKMLETLHKKAVEAEMASIVKSKQRSTVVRPLKIEMDTNKEGEESGLMKFQVNRVAKKGMPVVADIEEVILDRAFIRKGSTVKVQLQVRSYNVAGAVGLAVVLEAVQIVEEAEMPEGYVAKPKGISLAFSDVNLDNPFEAGM